MSNQVFSPERKEQTKRIRTVVEWVILAVLVLGFLIMFFDFHTYRHYNAELVEMGDQECLALAIPGVNRIRTDEKLGEEDLQALLKALDNLGYVSVTQEDLEAYVKSGEQLPTRSVFLLFQDGTRDTAALAQSALEQYNFKATMLENNESEHRGQNLSTRDMETLEVNTYWEMGIDEELMDQISFLQVDSSWSVNHLLLEIASREESLVSGSKASLENEISTNVPQGMEQKSGYTTVRDNRLILTTDRKGIGKLYLDSEKKFQNVDISVEFAGSENGTQRIAMRVNGKNAVYVQVTGKKIQLFVRRNGVDEKIDEADLENFESSSVRGYETEIQLSEESMTVYVNQRIVFNNSKISVTEPGKVMLTATNKEGTAEAEDSIYDAIFQNLIVTGDGTELYDGSMKWYQSLRNTLKTWQRDLTAWVQQID